eukprot:jgi/Chlat1/3602/Chrsp234S03584
MDDEDMRALLAWAAEHGVRDHVGPIDRAQGLRVEHFPDAGGRGLAACRAIPAGAMVLEVPLSVMMSQRSALADCHLAAAIRQVARLSSEQLLAAHILSEVSKGRSSFWYRYLRTLPRSLSTLAHFTPRHAALLQVQDAVEAALAAAAAARNPHKRLKQLLLSLGLPAKYCTLQAVRWALAVIASRTVFVPFDSAGALCPVGDLFNYACPPAPCTPALNWMEADGVADPSTCSAATLVDGCYDTDANVFRFYARKDYAPNEQVLVCYGRYTNLELLELYGFVLANNQSDSIAINGPCSNPVSAAEERCVYSSGRPSWALLTAMRMHAEQQVHKQGLSKDDANLLYKALSGEQLSVEGDEWVYKWLRSELMRSLALVPTSIEHDQKVLSSFTHSLQSDTPESTQLAQLALEWRILHKQTLAAGIAHAEEQLQHLRMQM